MAIAVPALFPDRRADRIRPGSSPDQSGTTNICATHTIEVSKDVVAAAVTRDAYIDSPKPGSTSQVRPIYNPNHWFVRYGT